MPKTLEKIEAFLAKHHLLSLATVAGNCPQSASLFYAYDVENVGFVVASDRKTEHIRNVLVNDKVSGTVALETDIVGKIEGIQFKGIMRAISQEEGSLYFKKFPYARVMKPQLWQIELAEIKLTDNRLGFGKKLYWQRADSRELE
ncbi:pyridoxamine 5'-phosphate oxidase family protein [Sulfurimonas sp. HSL3-7]|uniref:pyridoxamine 5'-phosphate oxidase family protein n=1 Tax=Sulfonitrofixus jiaomeiensis TaxID=3131938 RepID=UPI0031F96C9B